MKAIELLGKVLGTETAEGATYDECVELLDGALRLGVVMPPELKDRVTAFLAEAANNALDAADEEGLVFAGHKEFIEVEKHQSPEGVEVPDAAPEAPELAPEEVAGMLEVGVIENIWQLGRVGLAAKTVKQLKAMCRLLSCRIGGRKADIVARLALLASIEEMPQSEVVGDATKYPVGIAELLPVLQHRTSDGRWYLKDYRIAFRLEVEGRTLKWSQKGIVPSKWAQFAGTAMLVPAVVAPVASAS